MNAKARQELIGIGALLVGLFLGLTLLRLPITGSWGDHIGSLLWHLLGVGAVLLPLLGLIWALAAFERLGTLSAGRAAALGGGLVLLLPYGIGIASGRTFPADYATWSRTQHLVGAVPAFLAVTVHQAVGTAGGALVGLFALSALGILTVGWHPLALLRAGEGSKALAKLKHEPAKPPEEPPVPKPRKPKPTPTPPASRVAPRGPEGVLIPPLDCLHEPAGDVVGAGLEKIEEMGRRLIETLETFRVGGSIADKTVGPVVTRYEIAPAPGVKVGRIASLADDLALAMKAQSLRIVAPIPGKAAVGIEVPNPVPRMVLIRELIASDEFRRANRALPVALGRNLEGDEVVSDLAKMPHLLIAGVTGSGKSVCINTIITSLIYTHPPERLRLLMIDPKMVELSVYADLPHLGHPVVTNNHKAATVFKWAVSEMERRYRLFHANHARNVADFNRKVEEKKPLADAGTGDGGRGKGDAGEHPSPVARPPSPYTAGVLPYIVLIVDELADLMMTVQGEIETPLATLAQKARAVGIHLLLATQRPSVNVITGLIKANFPCRIAFRVSAKVDSRTILDQNGAEALLGNGDMLFLPPGKSEPVRIQGAFITTEETERLMAWYRDHVPAAAHEKTRAEISAQIQAIEDAEERGDEGRGTGEGGGSGEHDPLFRQAAEVCIQNQIGSTSLLQRRMSIGYGRAARIIDQLELAGILGPANGSKPRDVLVGLEELDEICGRE
jgi:S-DNA-T family DNA segregation ATPase FtsK/SpoIIIE